MYKISFAVFICVSFRPDGNHVVGMDLRKLGKNANAVRIKIGAPINPSAGLEFETAIKINSLGQHCESLEYSDYVWQTRGGVTVDQYDPPGRTVTIPYFGMCLDHCGHEKKNDCMGEFVTAPMVPGSAVWKKTMGYLGELLRSGVMKVGDATDVTPNYNQLVLTADKTDFELIDVPPKRNGPTCEYRLQGVNFKVIMPQVNYGLPLTAFSSGTQSQFQHAFETRDFKNWILTARVLGAAGATAVGGACTGNSKCEGVLGLFAYNSFLYENLSQETVPGVSDGSGQKDAADQMIKTRLHDIKTSVSVLPALVQTAIHTMAASQPARDRVAGAMCDRRVVPFPVAAVWAQKLSQIGQKKTIGIAFAAWPNSYKTQYNKANADYTLKTATRNQACKTTWSANLENCLSPTSNNNCIDWGPNHMDKPLGFFKMIISGQNEPAMVVEARHSSSPAAQAAFGTNLKADGPWLQHVTDGRKLKSFLDKVAQA